jgi:hypothetical protein
MPTHSVESWKWFCGRQRKDEVEDIRIRAVKASLRRSELALEQEDEIEPEEDEEELQHENAALSNQGAISVSSSPPIRAKMEAVEEGVFEDELEGDFAFVKQFFASGAGDTGTEVEVWQNMTLQVSFAVDAFAWKLIYIAAEMQDGPNMEGLL